MWNKNRNERRKRRRLSTKSSSSSNRRTHFQSQELRQLYFTFHFKTEIVFFIRIFAKVKACFVYIYNCFVSMSFWMGKNRGFIPLLLLLLLKKRSIILFFEIPLEITLVRILENIPYTDTPSQNETRQDTLNFVFDRGFMEITFVISSEILTENRRSHRCFFVVYIHMP